MPKPSNLLLKPFVARALDHYQLGTPAIVFPSIDITEEEIEHTDASTFLLLLNEKIQPDNQLVHLYLQPCSLKVLQGLSTHLLDHHQLKVDHLHLDMNGVIIDDDFTNTLVFMLEQLSASGIKELHLDCDPNPFSDEELAILTQQINRIGVTVKINLPTAAQSTQHQFAIDSYTQHHAARARIIKTANEIREIQKKEMEPSATRTRSIFATQAVSIDVELQVQAEVAFQQEVAQEAEKPQIQQALRLIESLDDLKDKVLSQELMLNPGINLVSDYDITRAWHTWFGNVATFDLDGKRFDLQHEAPPLGAKITVHKNLKIASITVEACEQLLNYYPQFQYGLDFDNLPAGFHLIEYPPGSNQEVLHFDQAYAAASVNTPLAPVLKTLPKAIAIDYDRYLFYTKKLAENSSFQRIHEELLILIGPPYQREAYTLLMSYLPKLLRYSPEDLEILFYICQEKAGFSAKRLHFMLEHGEQIRRTDNVDAARQILNKKPIKNKGSEAGEEEDRLALFLATEEREIEIHEHPLFSLFEDNPLMVDQIADWLEQYELTSRHLDVLMDLYGCCGSAGLERLFAIRNMHPVLLKAGHSYLPIITNAHIQEALDIIASFPEEQRRWWDALYAQHTEAVGYDDLPSLVKSFEAFTQEILKHGLTFYTPIHFNGIKNMPTALARMLSILKHCQPEDLTTQWACITQLSLQSDGAIRAITNKSPNEETCSVVLPEMHCHATEYNATSGYAAYFSLADTENFLKDYIVDQKELEKQFYRYLAYQKYRRPIQEYRELLKNPDVHKWSKDIPIILYRLLAEATTGSENYLSIQNFAQLETLWREFLSGLDALQFNPVLNAMIPTSQVAGDKEEEKGYSSLNHFIIQDSLKQEIAFFNPIPSFQALNQLLRLLQDSIEIMFSIVSLQQKNPWGIDTATLPGVKEDTNFLMRRTALLEFAMRKQTGIKGLLKTFNTRLLFSEISKFSTEEKQKKQFFFKYIAFFKALQGGNHRGEAFIPLAATFGLFDADAIEPYPDTDTSCQAIVAPLYDANMQDENSQYHQNIQCALTHLAHIQKRDPDLTRTTLLQFLLTLEFVSSTDVVLEMVKARFGNHFSSTYFETIARGDISDTLKKFAKAGVTSEANQQLIIAILQRFYLEPNVNQLETISTLLKQCLRELNQQDANTLLRMLTRNKALYQPNTKAEDFCQLLRAALDSNCLSEMMCLLSEAEAEKIDKNLTAIIIEYLMLVLPAVPLIESRTLKKYELLSLARRFALASNKIPIDSNTIKRMLSITAITVDKFPGAKNEILEFLPLLFKESLTANEDLDIAEKNAILMYKFLSSLEDKRVVFSLCYHFSRQNGHMPLQLLKIVNSNFKYLSLERRNFLLNIICLLLNNNQTINFAALKLIIGRCEDEKYADDIFIILKKMYKSAPLPSLDTVLEWIETSETPKDIQQKHAIFDINPCEREEINGFEFAKAKQQALQFQGYTFYREDIEILQKNIAAVRNYTTAELVKALQETGKAKTPDSAMLVALSAELLYRTKGLPAIREGKTRQWGRSFEINTTQYLAIYATLKSGRQVTAQVESSEGKTRINMILAACQFAMGNTVDFVTTDMTLARREYAEYSYFFHTLGAKTSLIHADSQADHYTMKGINFSDDANLNLFRNKARSEGLDYLVINRDMKKRTLIHDEGDKALFDMAETRFNYSSQASSQLKDMEWIYPLLIEFFDKRDIENRPLNQAIFYKDKDACTKLFLSFCETSQTLSPAKLTRLKLISKTQLESWQEAAMSALRLVFNKDFVIIPNTIIPTARGPKAASVAKVRAEDQLSPHSKFSFGVQQCLHARLNRLKALPYLSAAEDLKHALAACEQPFYIEEEKQITYSSTNKDLFDDYNEGVRYILSGTIGSALEREEAALLYKSAQGEEMRQLIVPRHLPLKREELPIQLVKDSEHLADFLAEDILHSAKTKQPEFIFCEDDSVSGKLQQQLEKRLPKNQALKRIHALTEAEEEDFHIQKEAGKPGMTTISTGKIGRGTDIRVAKEAEKHGAKGINTHLVGSRETHQRRCRAGRFRDAGQFQRVYKKDALKKQLHKKSLNDGFYTATESYIKREEEHIDQIKQNKRLIHYTVGDFKKKLTINFFEDFYNKQLPYFRFQLDPLWKQFMYETDKAWSEIRENCVKLATDVPPNIDAINAALLRFHGSVQISWQELRNQIKQIGIAYARKAGEFEPVKIGESCVKPLYPNLPKLALSDKAVSLMHKSVQIELTELKTPIAERYHPAHDGRAVLYTRPFELIRATLTGERKWFADFRAWKSGIGILFPNLRAFFKGHLSFAQLLFGSFGVAKPETKAPSWEKAKLRRLDTSLIMQKQLGILAAKLEKYPVGKRGHTRTTRVNYVKKSICARQHLFANKPLEERQYITQYTLAELYLQYASIENSSSKLSHSLEDALVKILQIPKAGPLAEARANRKGVLYRMNTFLNAGRLFLKSYHDKMADPVHHLIFDHLPEEIKTTLDLLKKEREQLDQQDMAETAMFKKPTLTNKDFIHISSVLLSKLNPLNKRSR